MASLYNEVTAVYSRDRVLDKLKDPLTQLPFTIDDIKISHNDFAIADVLNNSVRKLYSNYLYLIANSEIVTASSPTSADFGFISINDSGAAKFWRHAGTQPITAHAAASDGATSIVIKYPLGLSFNADHIITFSSGAKFKNSEFVSNGNSGDTATVNGSLTGDVAINEIGTVQVQGLNNGYTLSYAGTRHTGHTGTAKLSSVQETHIVKTIDGSEKFVYFNYGIDDSNISTSNISSVTAHNTDGFTTLLSGNQVEYNKDFEFENIVSVDTSNNFHFVLDKGLETLFKFDITGLITDDPAVTRTSLTSDLPGKVLVKSIGINSQATLKNKLRDPRSVSVYKDRVYVLDNGNYSIKVFDLNLNFITDLKSRIKFDAENEKSGKMISISVGPISNIDDTPIGYILTSKGNIFTYDITNNRILTVVRPYEKYDTRLTTLSTYNERDTFKKILHAKSNKNILYVSTNKSIFKFYKTNLNIPICSFDLSNADILLHDSNATSPELGTAWPQSTPNLTDAQQIVSFGTVEHSNKEFLAVTTTTLNEDFASRKTGTYIFGDDNVPELLYNTTLYNNYFSLSDIIILPQEIVNNITFNKTTKKLIYNHFSLFENLNKKLYMYWNNFRVPTLCSICGSEFTAPSSFTVDDNNYIGINEPIMTDVINRSLTKLYRQQVDLFDLIKDEQLNNDPPSNVKQYLPASLSAARTDLVSFDSTTSTVAGGEGISFTVNRVNETIPVSMLPECSFLFYIVPTDLVNTAGQLTEKSPGIGVIEAGKTNVEISQFASLPNYTGVNKTFDIIIKPHLNCDVDPTKNQHTVTVTQTPGRYEISLSATNPTTIIRGETARIGVVRSLINSHDTFADDVSCNIHFTPHNVSNNDFFPTPVSYSTTAATVCGNYADDFVPTGIVGQVSAQQISTTSTLYFSQGVSSIVFDLSAARTAEEHSDRSIDITLTKDTASSLSRFGTIKSQSVQFDKKYTSINLHVSSISADYDQGSGFLKEVNVWAALSADTTYQASSTLGPVDITFTLSGTDGATPLSSYSSNTLSGAVMFVPTDPFMLFTQNKLKIEVGENNAIVGKGGQGGHGAVWLSGHKVDQATEGVDALSASFNEGEDGGPAIFLEENYLNTFALDISGTVYGGAGGGGGGILPLTANSMLVNEDGQTNSNRLSALSAAAGGGGGRGIHAENVGAAGIAGGDEESGDDVIDAHNSANEPKMADGAAGTTSAGGAGGDCLATNKTATTDNGAVDFRTVFPQVTGLSGGDLGQDGMSDPEYDRHLAASWTDIGFGNSQAPAATGTTFAALATGSDWLIWRQGGNKGLLVENKPFTFIGNTFGSGTSSGN